MHFAMIIGMDKLEMDIFPQLEPVFRGEVSIFSTEICVKYKDKKFPIFFW